MYVCFPARSSLSCSKLCCTGRGHKREGKLLNLKFMDVIYEDALWKPPDPICICNHSGNAPLVYSLLDCDPNCIS